MADKPETKSENRLRNAGIRMALKLLPDDMLAAAPAHLEKYLNERLAAVELEPGEAGTVILIAPQDDGSTSVLTVTLDEANTVRRVVEKTDIAAIFRGILDNLKEL